MLRLPNIRGKAGNEIPLHFRSFIFPEVNR